MNIRLPILAVVAVVSAVSLNAARQPANKLNPAQEMLHKGLVANSPETIKQALETAIKQGDDTKTPVLVLLKAIMTESAAAIKAAMQPVIEEGKDHKAPLAWAVLLQKPNAAKVLVECGAKVDPKIVHFATSMNNVETALEIVRSGVDITGFEADLARLALQQLQNANAVSLIQTIVKRGYNINNFWYFGPNNVGHTFELNCDVIQFLFENGANPNHTFEKEAGSVWTPLIATILRGDKDAVQLLLKGGADIDQPGNPYPNHANVAIRGLQTPLAFAIHFGNQDIVKLLLERSADLE